MLWPMHVRSTRKAPRSGQMIEKIEHPMSDIEKMDWARH
jgi:hypothetical protein